MRRHGRGLASRGQSLVEFALILPVFLLMLMGLIDGGRAVYSYNTLSNAAREGARMAIIPSNTVAVVKQTVIDKSVALKLTADDVTVSSRTPGQPVTVSVSYRFKPVVALVAEKWGADTISMSASASMTVEGDVGGS